MPLGHPQQAVDELGQRLTSLSDVMKIVQAKERSRRRQEVATQLQSTTRQLNIIYKQNFTIGDRVLVKHKCRGAHAAVQIVTVYPHFSPPPLSAVQGIHHFQRQ